MPTVELFANSFATFLQIYLVLLLIRILLSWFPNVNWYNPPFSVLSQLTDPYLNIFRALIPPLGGMDFSPILAIFLLQVVAQLFGQIG
ncbi:membrane protein [Neosynechococcus sphagnicola sy1]|uniref:Membrane protein n=1 Tax=Neosynechococcus sphagnicola sy1 TaxID=1497020 RepID=A0A098TJU0_9CYAN|nr:YggT family protein [Neosynechococcus sphagnicola]KGF72595.1 membrane protein [Neosynechococcus sphagnicola sy1]